MSRQMDDAWMKLKGNLRAKKDEHDAENGVTSEESARQPIVYHPPKHLTKKLGEATWEYMDRIVQAAKDGDRDAQAEIFRAKGILNDNRSWSHLDLSGNPVEGYQHDVESEASNAAARRRLYGESALAGQQGRRALSSPPKGLLPGEFKTLRVSKSLTKG